MCGKLDVHIFMELELNSNDKTYFVGQTYHQNKVVDEITKLASKLKTTKKFRGKNYARE